MKKIICMLLLIQGGFLMAQTETVVTVNGKKITVNPNALNTADNGLTATNGNVQLGGALLKPSTIVTTPSYTLAIQGLQAGATTDNVLVIDANGVLKSVSRASLGDNLGNHTATQDLNMSSKNINNINTANMSTANVSYAANINDRNTANTNNFIFYKNDGVLGIYNSLKGGNDLAIDEATRKTGVNNLSINKGTDGSLPAAGYVAVAADAAGNVVWKAASTIAGATGATGPAGPQGPAGATGTFDTGSLYPLTSANSALTVTGGGKLLTAATALDIKGGTAGQVLSSNGTGSASWKDAAGDNLGNHTATQDLNMSNKDINNIKTANITTSNISYAENFKDRNTANTNNFILYKTDGLFGIYNSLKSGNDLTIDEATRKTGVNNLSINRGTDGSVPAAGYVATSADASGNVVWKAASSLAVSGDNLGNHAATQDLAMSGKNIAGAANVTATGTATAANVTATTKVVTPAAQITTGAGLNKVAVSDASGNVVWTDPATIDAKGDNLGNHTATENLNMSSKNVNNINNAYINNLAVFNDRTTTNTDYFSLYKNNGFLNIWAQKGLVNALSINETTGKTNLASAQISNGTDGGAPIAGSIATAADSSGNIIWKAPDNSGVVTSKLVGFAKVSISRATSGTNVFFDKNVLNPEGAFSGDYASGSTYTIKKAGVHQIFVNLSGYTPSTTWYLRIKKNGVPIAAIDANSSGAGASAVVFAIDEFVVGDKISVDMGGSVKGYLTDLTKISVFRFE